MANIKSAKKRILVNRTKAARNKSIRSAVKTSIRKVDQAVANNDKAKVFITKTTAQEKFPVYPKPLTALANRYLNF